MNKKKFRIVPIVLILAFLLSACSLDELDEMNKKYENPTASVPDSSDGSTGKTTSAPTPEVTAAPDSDSKTPEVTGALNPDPASTDKPVTEPPQVSSTPVPSTEPAPTGQAGDTVAEPTPVPTEVPAPVTNSPTPTATPRDVADREEYRAMTFLVWVPLFEYGVFSDKDASTTYDYAIFTEVSEADVAAYKAKLTKAGFTRIITDSEKSYKAMNQDDWCVTLEYRKNTLTLGSGFDDKVQNEDDTLRKLYGNTMLQYVPEFKGGSYESSETVDDESNYTYIYYSSVTEDSVREYIKALKNAGYVYGDDEGDMDGIIWYMAMNEEVMSCYVAYDNGIVKIGCGYGE